MCQTVAHIFRDFVAKTITNSDKRGDAKIKKTVTDVFYVQQKKKSVMIKDPYWIQS